MNFNILLISTIVIPLICIHGMDNLDLIGRPFGLKTANQMWPSNSVYIAFTQIVVSTNNVKVNYIYNRYVVDKIGVNPGHGDNQTGDYVSPSIQYHTLISEPNTEEKLWGFEVFNSTLYDTITDPLCKELGVLRLSFKDAVRVASNQLWKVDLLKNSTIETARFDNQCIWLDKNNSKMEIYKVCYKFRKKRLHSLSIFKDDTLIKKKASDDILSKNKDRLIDMSFLELNSCRRYYKDTKEIEPVNKESSSDDGARVLRGLARMRRKAEKSQVVFNKMAQSGIVFHKEIKTSAYPISSHNVEYTSHGQSIKVVTEVSDMLGSFYEFVICIFVNTRAFNNSEDLCFAGIGKVPSTRKLCYEKFSPVYECNRFDGKQTVTVFEGNLAIIFTNEQTECVSFGFPPICGKEFFELLDFHKANFCHTE